MITKVVDAPKSADTTQPSKQIGFISAEAKIENEIPNRGAQISANVVLGNNAEY